MRHPLPRITSLIPSPGSWIAGPTKLPSALRYLFDREGQTFPRLATASLKSFPVRNAGAVLEMFRAHSHITPREYATDIDVFKRSAEVLRIRAIHISQIIAVVKIHSIQRRHNFH